MLNMFKFEQLPAQTIQLAQTGNNKLHGNKLHVWTGLLDAHQRDINALVTNYMAVCRPIKCTVYDTRVSFY